MSKAPKLFSVRNVERGSSLGHRIGLADRWWTQLKGLIGRTGLEEGAGLLITSSQGVHMWWMKPGKRARMHWDAHYALELPVGLIDESGTREGDVLKWEAGEP